MIFYRRCFYFLLVALFCVACGEDEKSNRSSTTTDDDPTTIDDTPVGVVESTGFWIQSKSEWYTSYVNEASGFGEECFIDIDETTNKNITCYIDILEGDFYMHELPLQYNVPPGLCEHLAITPAWHWNYSSGNGPKSYSVEVKTVGDADVIFDLDASGDGGCQSTLSDDSVVNCSANREISGFDGGNNPKCAYDYSETGGPNCCFGDYTYTVSHDTDGDNTADSVETGEREWGGDVASCIGGAVVTSSWEVFSSEGYPGRLIIAVPGENQDTSGLNEQFSIASNGTTAKTSFSYASNFYTTTATPHNHDGYVSATTSDKPYAVEPIDDIDGSAVISGSDAWVFDCLDAGFESQHKISVYIREWNTLADFIAYETSEGATYNPDVIGVEGTNCDYSGTFAGACNDFWDFDDILTAIGGTYTTNNVPASAATTRRTYFPQVKYTE